MATRSRFVEPGRGTRFDVLCVGETVWKAERSADVAAPPIARAGLLDVARALARRGLRVGLATVLDDDRVGRALLAEVAGAGIDTRGVTLAPPSGRLVVVDAAGGRLGVVAEREETLEVPEAWTSEVLLVSGLSPITAKAAALCKAARRARRERATVVVDLASGLRQWVDREAKTIFMVLKEADVVRASLVSLSVLGLDPASVRAAMRADATLVVAGGGRAVAAGPFGEVVARAPEGSPEIAPDAITASIAADLARPPRVPESASARWDRSLRASLTIGARN